MMRKWLGSLAICAALMIPGWSLAEEARSDEAALSTMEDVVVTASRAEEEKKEVTASVVVISEQDIRMSSAADLGELLAEKGIGHIQQYPGISTSIGIRGFRTDATGNDLAGKVLILIDGRRAGTGDVAKIMTANVARVEIIRGPASVQYGSAAMGGVVNVITKKGEGPPGFFAEGGLGSFDHETGTAGFSGSLEKFDFSGSATRESMDDYVTADGDDYDNTGYDKKQNASLNLGVEFLPRNHLRLIYHYFDADEAGSAGYLSQSDPDAYSDIGLESADFVYDGQTSDGFLAWNTRYFTGKDEYKWVDPTWASLYTKDTDHRGGQGQISGNWENTTVTGGFDWVNYDIDSNTAPEKSEYDNPACFILAKTRLVERLILSGGLRYDDYEVDMKSDGGREKDDNLASNLGAAYIINDHVKARAGYGEAFRMPTAEQLAGDYVAWISYLGNPELKPETSETYEAGFDLTHAFTDFSVTGFVTDFKDKIEVYTLPTFEQSYKNIGGASIQGIESEISFDAGAFLGWAYDLRPYGSIVYLTKYEDDETDEDLLYTEDMTASWGLVFSDKKGLSTDLNFAYTGDKKVEDWENWSDPVNIIHCGGFTVANFTVHQKILDFAKRGGLTVKGEIRNIFDRDYAYVAGYPMPGRNFFIGVRYEY